MKATKGPVFAGGPLIRAHDPWPPGNPSTGKPHQLFNDEERVWLVTIASVARFKKGEAIYSAGEPAKFLFNIISGIISGVVKVYLVARKSRESIVSLSLRPGSIWTGRGRQIYQFTQNVDLAHSLCAADRGDGREV